MKRAFNYYIGLTLATWLSFWLVMGANHSGIRFQDTETQSMIAITAILILNAVFLLLNRSFSSQITRIGSILFLTLTTVIYIGLLFYLIYNEFNIYAWPFYLTVIYCLIFSVLLLVRGNKAG